jgi:hypothetical protein
VRCIRFFAFRPENPHQAGDQMFGPQDAMNSVIAGLPDA